VLARALIPIESLRSLLSSGACARAGNEFAGTQAGRHMRIASLQLHLPWRDLAKRTYEEALEDDALGLAAQLAYYFFLAVFPTLLFLLAVASFFPIARFTDTLPAVLGRFAAPEMVSMLRTQLQQISNAGNGGLLSLGLLGAVWSSSAALVSIISALNRAYDIDEGRPWWKVRLVAIALTVGLAVFVLAAFTLVLGGPALTDLLANVGGLGTAFKWSWNILQWPLAFFLVSTALGLVYYFAPDAEQDWVWVTPGSLLATALWLVGSLLFRYYVVSFGNYQATYGALGGVIVLLLWMYMTGLIIVLGAEVNAEIEHASPWGKEPGEKVPGERKKLGTAAERAFRAKPPGAQRPTVSPARPAAASAAPALPPAGSTPAPLPAAPAPTRATDWLLAWALRAVWPRLRRRT
jgi:membrane protein